MVHTKSTSVNSTSFYSGCFTCRNRAWICGYQFAINRVLQHISRMGSYTIPSSVCHLFKPITIGVIVLMVAPFKIASSIVTLVFILMVDTRIVVRIWNKRFGNKSMNRPLATIFSTMYSKIPICNFNGFKYLLFTSMPIIKTHYSSEVTNLVNTLVPLYIFPNFFFHKLSINC